ncbi:class I SAM-dependent methyltransferase [Longitalea arenae]|uniref:class I SAM-dependent methyltransferase n=1 Tax=Longitalea arenae TaxID=2812558 RepID=UPI0019682C74|nr:class I SAM-dependent methyltransferase [Longitalea arenae]
MPRKESNDVEKLISLLEYMANGINQNERRTEDVYSLGLLQPLMQGYPYLGFTGFSMRPYCINHIINDIIINGRQCIIEFGAGISTILISRLIKKNGLNTTVISVDHEDAWAKLINEQLKNEQLCEVATVISIPLRPCDLALDGSLWYAVDLLNLALKDRQFDMAIIDGPPAWEPSKERARYPALPYLIDRLQSRSSVYLDDVNRKGEQDIIERWKKEFGLAFNIAGSSLAWCTLGQAFHTAPIRSHY